MNVLTLSGAELFERELFEVQVSPVCLVLERRGYLDGALELFGRVCRPIYRAKTCSGSEHSGTALTSFLTAKYMLIPFSVDGISQPIIHQASLTGAYKAVSNHQNSMHGLKTQANDGLSMFNQQGSCTSNACCRHASMTTWRLCDHQAPALRQKCNIDSVTHGHNFPRRT